MFHFFFCQTTILPFPLFPHNMQKIRVQRSRSTLLTESSSSRSPVGTTPLLTLTSAVQLKVEKKLTERKKNATEEIVEWIGEIHSLMPCASCGMMERSLCSRSTGPYPILLWTELSELFLCPRLYPIVLKWHWGFRANSGHGRRKKNHTKAAKDCGQIIKCASRTED